jgi:hypothetical protein
MKKVQTPKELLEPITQEATDYDPNLGIPFDTPPKGAPSGQKWTYNRWDQNYPIVFDGTEEVWGPQCYRLVQLELAKFVERKGYLKFDPMGQHDIKALVTQDDKHYGQPLPTGMERPIEVLHRDGIEAPKAVILVPIPK